MDFYGRGLLFNYLMTKATSLEYDRLIRIIRGHVSHLSDD